MSTTFPQHVAHRLAGLAVFAGLFASVLSAEESERPRDATTPQPMPTRRIVVQLSRELFAPIVDRRIDRLTSVTDVVLGTPVQGQARTVGQPELELVDDPTSAAFVIRLTGTTVARTVGRNGPAIIYTRADTRFAAAKRIEFQPGRGFVASPAAINTITRTRNEGIDSTRGGLIGRIIRRRAAREVADAAPAVEAIAQQRAETRIRAAFDNFLEDRLARLNRNADLRQAIVATLGGDGEPNFACCTRNECVLISISRGPEDKMIALPVLNQRNAPVQVWVHNSLVGDNLSAIVKQFDLARPGANLAEQALEAIPGVVKERLGLPEGAAAADIPVNYATAEDWLVIQVETDPTAVPPARAAPARVAAGACQGGSESR